MLQQADIALTHPDTRTGTGIVAAANCQAVYRDASDECQKDSLHMQEFADEKPDNE